MPKIGTPGSMNGVEKWTLLAAAPYLDSSKGFERATFEVFLKNSGRRERLREGGNSLKEYIPAKVRRMQCKG